VSRNLVGSKELKLGFHPMLDRVCIGAVAGHTSGYYRGVLRGLRRYAEARPQWLLSLFTPELESLRVPRDVALLGVGDDELHCELARPALSSVIVPAQGIGYAAAALLERLLDGGKPPSEPILLPPLGVAVRSSTEALEVDDQEVSRAVGFIRRNAHRRILVTHVVQHLRLGQRTLERRFRAALGHGICEEIQRARLDLARRLLVETDLPLQALAEQAGYRDVRRLCEVFRAKLGTTPTTYRRRMQTLGCKGPASPS